MTGASGSYITEFTTPYAAVPSSMCSASLTTAISTIPYPYHSLTAILVSRFLINLQEAHHRSVKVDSDDPAYISSHSENSLPSFVAAPGTTGTTGQRNAEGMGDGMVEDRESAEVDHWEGDTHGVDMMPLAARV